eukprot:CAMPEP_0115561100 /NCGR_PEP_ID=MMETSP0271-20121206/100810_1 /TAXON_ID=71861 /ORGANISM="Scrippsiella trochoidea, Strain CCMP3099" /LENGTH=57 /DNA_ID=CAMNT_0002995197 /DNA_START=1 /DNA_END=171 /DNA_ORIENTATION=-
MTAMELPAEVGGLTGYRKILEEEHRDFVEFCSQSPALQGMPDIQKALPAALADLRSL